MGILIATLSQPNLIENNIFCNGGSVKIIGMATPTSLKSNTIFQNQCNKIQLEDEVQVT